MGVPVRGAVAATVVLLALAAMFAGGSDGLRPPGGLSFSLHHRDSSTTQQQQPTGTRQRSTSNSTHRTPTAPQGSPAGQLAGIVREVFLLLLAGGIIVALASVLRFSVVRRRQRHRVRPSPLPLGRAEPDEAAQGLTEALELGLAELDEGSVRNAVVAAWIRLEEHVVRSGVERHPEDTPAEFVARAESLDRVALDELADLYREARFSRHPIGERQREAARGCLTRLIERRPSGVRG